MLTLTRCNDDRVGLARSCGRSRRKPPGGSRKGRYAFTLVELLVVVAIIALLVSILLPTLNKAKDQAKAVVCATRLKGIMLATSLYTHDFNGWVHAAWGGYENVGGDGETWYGAMIDEELLPEAWDSDISGCMMAPKDEWGRYSYGMRATYVVGGGGAWGLGYFDIGSPLVRCRSGYSEGQPYYDEDDFYTYPYCPGDFVIYTDSIAWASYNSTWRQWYCVYEAPGWRYYVDLRHTNRANCAFADGHVRGLGRDELHDSGFDDAGIWPSVEPDPEP